MRKTSPIPIPSDAARPLYVSIPSIYQKKKPLAMAGIYPYYLERTPRIQDHNLSFLPKSCYTYFHEKAYP